MESMFRNRPQPIETSINPEITSYNEFFQPQLVIAIIKIDQGAEKPRFAVMEGDNIIAVYTSFEEMSPDLPTLLKLNDLNDVTVESM